MGLRHDPEPFDTLTYTVYTTISLEIYWKTFVGIEKKLYLCSAIWLPSSSDER